MLKKKDFQKLAGIWLAGKVVNHVGIYGSKAAEGLSAFQRRPCLNSCISGMGGPINMEWKGNEAIGCYTYYVTFSYDFDLEFWRSNFKKALS